MNELKTGFALQNGKYRIERVLGQGGFGITYLAVQVNLNRKVAIKEFFMKELCNRDATTSHVSVPSTGSATTVERFRSKFVKEAQTIAGLDNPHIIRIHDIFNENGTAYYVMDYLGNGSLSDRVKSGGPMDAQTATTYIRQIGEALTYLHARSINHLGLTAGAGFADLYDLTVLDNNVSVNEVEGFVQYFTIFDNHNVSTPQS